MPVEVVSYMLSSLDPKKCLQFQIVLWCAPFLKGMKTACAVNIEEQYCPELEGILADTDIEYRYLSRDKGKRLVFFTGRRNFRVILGEQMSEGFWSASDMRSGSLRRCLTGCRKESAGISAVAQDSRMRSAFFWIIPSTM